MTLQDLLTKKFGVKTTHEINPVTDTVGTSTTKVLGNNPNRLAFTIINLSSNVVYLGFDRDVSSSKGIYLSPNGGSLSMLYDEDFNSVGYEVFGKAADDSKIYLIEIVTTP